MFKNLKKRNSKRSTFIFRILGNLLMPPVFKEKNNDTQFILDLATLKGTVVNQIHHFQIGKSLESTRTLYTVPLRQRVTLKFVNNPMYRIINEELL